MRAGSAVEEISGGPWDPDGTTCEYQLYKAVLDKKVRSELDGKLIEDTSFIRRQQWNDTRPYTLPGDLYVNVEDVRRIWNIDDYDVADLIALGVLSPGGASGLLETSILNMRTLHRRVQIRLTALDLASALAETDFNARWTRHLRDCLLLLAVTGQSEYRLAKLRDEFEKVVYFTDALVGRHRPNDPSRGGRKPTYDWAAAEEHVEGLFQHHGSLSPDDPTWSTQADVERAILKFFKDSIGKEPAASLARKKAKEIIGRRPSRK